MKKSEYKLKNESFLTQIALRTHVLPLHQGVLYCVLKKGEGPMRPNLQSIVSVHYCGKLIDGRVFDTTYDRGYPEAFRVNQVIEGLQIALLQMCIGDKWEVIIPQQMGYGKKSIPGIPGFSVLIFEVELISIG